MSHPRSHTPTLDRQQVGHLAYWTDPWLLGGDGVLVAFTERTGGVSHEPYRSLNLAAHVGDEASSVDENRSRLLSSVRLEGLRTRLTMAEQVHGHEITLVTDDDAGRGAFAARGPAPIRAADALVTREPNVPLMLCFADCVPVVLVAPGPSVAVVHAGWRGALEGLPGATAAFLAHAAGADADRIIAYVGPHIGACCYEVGPDVMSQFDTAFGTVSRAESGALDLGSIVKESLSRAGVPTCSIAHLGACTAQTTERFFSHRAEGGLTGRHGALVCILPRA